MPAAAAAETCTIAPDGGTRGRRERTRRSAGISSVPTQTGTAPRRRGNSSITASAGPRYPDRRRRRSQRRRRTLTARTRIREPENDRLHAQPHAFARVVEPITPPNGFPGCPRTRSCSAGEGGAAPGPPPTETALRARAATGEVPIGRPARARLLRRNRKGPRSLPRVPARRVPARYPLPSYRRGGVP